MFFVIFSMSDINGEMHQIHQNHRVIEVGFNGLDRAALQKFQRSCAKRQPYIGLQLKKIREPQVIIIRNKYTKEIVDLEVKCVFFKLTCYIDCMYRSFKAIL